MFDRLFSRPEGRSDRPIDHTLTIDHGGDGLRYSVRGIATADWLEAPFAYTGVAETGASIAQLLLEGFGRQRDDHVLLPWPDVYTLREREDSERLCGTLGIPGYTTARPVLNSQGSLSDPAFQVFLSHWVDGNGAPLRDKPERLGALLKTAEGPGLLRPEIWRLLQQLQAFHAAKPADRTPAFNERAWSAMRRWAIQGHVPVSDYLANTIVVTPEKLTLDFRRRRVGEDNVIEVIPGFDGAPQRWLEFFDRMPLQDAYTVPDGKVMTRVLLSPPVRQVLSELKRMPGRRVTGARAQALIANPFAVLDEEAAEVIDADQIEQALEREGLAVQRFTPLSERAPDGRLQSVMLQISTLAGDHADVDTQIEYFADAGELLRFCNRLQAGIAATHQWCSWGDYDFELLPESADHLTQLRAWHAEWRQADQWRPDELFDLSHFSPRIEGFGVEKPYALPFIQKRSVELDWFVDNVLYGLRVRRPDDGQETLVQVDPGQLPAIQELIDEAEREQRSEVLLPDAPMPVPVEDARRAIEAIAEASKQVERRRFDPQATRKPATGEERPEPKHLIIKSNIEQVDHLEERAERLAWLPDTAPRLPTALKPDTSLKPHQERGVAWLQHLWSLSPTACRGALLADDMGLGKTLQLLTFMAACFEENPALPPALVVAPVALLENWRAELQRFFLPDSLPLLTLYGSALNDLRAPRDQLRDDVTRYGITKLLRKGWVGNAKVVLTTYETLRDLEFALASTQWSIMVCDEAQKIKNPSAMVTRAAKKQNVRFRIACTGTPVENTLLDLWCLFDFIQAGLLGALNQFQRTYKQPIEAKTEEQRAKVEELRRLIEPQTLRRTKQQVARDTLPEKLEDTTCRELPMSAQQLQHYWRALDTLKAQRHSDPSAVLQTLHHIRRLCSDPHWQQPDVALRTPLDQLMRESPKLRWLMEMLDRLKRLSREHPGEKVIVFCEFRDLQLLLQRAMRERLGLDVFVVNGDTSASLEVENSRQKLIDRFQAARGFNAIILSPLAVGFGVNIQAANHVVHFTRTWNPAKEDQATDRAYRIGQTRDVTVYYPSVVGDGFDSFDTVLHKLLSWKRELAQDMLNASGDLSAADFGELAA